MVKSKIWSQSRESSRWDTFLGVSVLKVLCLVSVLTATFRVRPRPMVATGLRLKLIILWLKILQIYVLSKLLKFNLIPFCCICTAGKEEPKQVKNMPEIQIFSSRLVERNFLNLLKNFGKTDKFSNVEDQSQTFKSRIFWWSLNLEVVTSSVLEVTVSTTSLQGWAVCHILRSRSSPEF